MTSPATPLDPRRWFVLVIVATSVFIVVLDNNVLNVAIPTILREFHTNLASLSWVISGYSLVFATLLIIGGRLGDVYGHRKMFLIGTGIFGVGSLLASISNSVPTLFVGEALIEGIGASLMLPATLALLSNTFRGRERATAFAAWATIAGATAAFAPLIGGYLTTYQSWRWAFIINVVAAPAAIIGTLVFVRDDSDRRERERLDVPGALLIAVGMFLVVFGIIEGSTYGFLEPTRTLDVLFLHWPASRPVSVIPIAFVLGLLVLGCFAVVEHSKERRGLSALFEFGLLKHLRFRYGILTVLILTMGQFGMFFVMAVLLQEGQHLSAVTTGSWLLPAGLAVIVGAQVGARLTRRIGVVQVVRVGMVVEAIGFLAVCLVVAPDVSLLALLPGFVLYGVGVGFAASQITNVVLSDVPRDKAGVASGTNTTSRQVGAALGIAVLGSLLTAQTVRFALDKVKGSSLSPALKAAASAQLHARGVNFTPPHGASPREVASLDHILSSAVASGGRPALLFAFGVVLLGAFVSFLIPGDHSHREPGPAAPGSDEGDDPETSTAAAAAHL